MSYCDKCGKYLVDNDEHGHFDTDTEVESVLCHSCFDEWWNAQPHFIPPYSVVPMPLNKDGEGPELDPKLVVQTLWEV